MSQYGDAPALQAAIGVAVLLSEHWLAIEADFRRFYGLDLADACFGTEHLGIRRLRSFIARLPQESALAREMGWSWSDEHELVATLIDLAVDQANSARATAGGVAALGGGKYRPPKTKPFPRPVFGAEVARDAVDERSAPLTREGMRAALLGPNPAG